MAMTSAELLNKAVACEEEGNQATAERYFKLAVKREQEENKAS